MATVRDTDLPDLLISLGYQVKRIGRYYTTQEMDSIRIKDRRTWFRYSEGIGGDAITSVSYTHLDVYKRQVHAAGFEIRSAHDVPISSKARLFTYPRARPLFSQGVRPGPFR